MVTLLSKKEPDLYREIRFHFFALALVRTAGLPAVRQYFDADIIEER